MIRGFKIICEYLRVSPNPKFFFYLFTLTRPSKGGLTLGWLSFRAHVNRKVFILFEKSFHDFKPIYFKVFRAPTTTPFWETQEGELTKANIYWNKNFEAPRVDEDDLTLEERAVAKFFLLSFRKQHLNLKGIVSVYTEVASWHLGFTFF